MKRREIITLLDCAAAWLMFATARLKLPAITPARSFVTAGGLISYGPDRIDPYRGAALYVDRILKGERRG